MYAKARVLKDHNHRRQSEYAYHITLKAALLEYPTEAKKSINGELKQLLDKNVWTPILRDSLTDEQAKSVIRSSIFLKENVKTSK